MPPRRPRTPWSRRRWVTVIGITLLVIALVAGWFALVAPRPPAAPATEVVKVTRSNEATSVSVSGVIAPQRQANVSFAVAGTVESVAVKVGESVKEGQTLASVDDRDLRNAVALAQAQLDAARAQVKTIRNASSSSSAQVTAAQAQVTSAQASLDQAQSRVRDATLAAPLTGVVATVSVEVGDQVSGGGSINPSALSGAATGGRLGGLSGLGAAGGAAGLPTGSLGASSASSGAQFVILVPDAWQLDATVGTADIAALKAGQAAIVTPKGTDTHVSGTVDSVGIVASGSAGQAATFPVTIKVNDASSRLFAGSSADAVVTTETVQDVTTLPGRAISYDGNTAHVRVPDGSALGRQVTVTTGRQFGDRTEIVSGLAVGDDVLTPVVTAVSAPPANPFARPSSTASASPSARR